jgi:hypothetical protein
MVLRFFGFLGLAGLSVAVAAQDFSPAIDPGIVAGIAGQRATQMQAERMARNRAGGAIVAGGTSFTGLASVLGQTTSGQSNLMAPGAAATSDVRLTYTPTPALQREAISGYVSRIERTNREAASVMRNVLAKQNYASVYNNMIRGSTLKANDAADAVTAYTVIGWQIANQDPNEISDARMDAVRRQLAPALAANPQISAPATRAALGEEMKLLALTLHAGWQSAIKEGNRQAYSDGVARMWKNQTGRDLRAVKLTDAGFSRR